MSQDFIQLADRTKLGSDSKTVTVGAAQSIIERQQLVSVPGTIPAEQAIAPAEAILELLASSDPSTDANVDGSGGAVAFNYQVAAGKALVLDEIALMIRDTGTFNGASFGAIAGPLTNGIKLEVRDTDGNTVLKSFIPAGVAKRHADLAAIPGAALLMVRIPALFEGWPLLVAAGQYVRLTVQDNLTTLEGFQAAVRGRLSSVS
jgi:hypothetical protein